MKDPRDVILAPVVSEKSYEQLEQNVYVLEVHTSASKPEIRLAVESIALGKISGRREGAGTINTQSD